MEFARIFINRWFQIFTNADKAHATQVLNRMGLEDCFEGVICFETLNPPNTPLHCADAPEANPTILPHSKILCKPSIEAIHAAIRIACVDPKKTVRQNYATPKFHFYVFIFFLFA